MSEQSKNNSEKSSIREIAGIATGVVRGTGAALIAPIVYGVERVTGSNDEQAMNRATDFVCEQFAEGYESGSGNLPSAANEVSEFAKNLADIERGKPR
jgi:hypothetical protein